MTEHAKWVRKGKRRAVGHAAVAVGLIYAAVVALPASTFLGLFTAFDAGVIAAVALVYYLAATHL